jgi:branched-chain amino acid transport system permease protein
LIFGISIPDAADFSQYVFSGLSQGCLYALIALAFVTIANVTGVYNFAQGDWVMVGSMVAVSASAAGFPVVLVIVASMAAVAGVALVQERVTVAPIRNRVGMLGLVVATLGVGVLLRGLALEIWGKDPRSLEPFNEGTFELLGATLADQTLWIWGATVLALAATLGLFRYTDIGRAMRACAMNPTAARLSGVRIGRMSMAAFLLGGALSGLIGAVVVPETGVSWSSGLALGLVGFIAAALARFEDPLRAVVAGLLLGVIQALAAGVISSSNADALLYSVLMIYLVGRELGGSEGTIRRLAHRRATARARASASRLAEAVRPRLRAAEERAGQAERGAAPAGRTAQQVWGPRLGVAALIGLAVLVPVATQNDSVATDTAIFIVLSAIGATGLSLALGIAGQFSLGQGAFYLLGGYGTGILTAQAGWGVVPSILAATAIAVAAGFVLAALTLRLEGFDLAIVTLAFHLILLVVAIQFTELTGGPLGVAGMLPFEPFGFDGSDPWNFYWIGLGVLVVSLVIARNITRSRIGRSLRAIALDEPGAESLGVNADRLKLGVLSIGAGMAGVAGGLWASYLQYAAPSTWDFNLTIALVTYVIVGGVSSVYGGLLGAIAVGSLQYLVTGSVGTGIGGGTSATQIIINGALIVGVILLFPGGLAAVPGRVRALWRRRSRRSPAAPAEPAGTLGPDLEGTPS